MGILLKVRVIRTDSRAAMSTQVLLTKKKTLSHELLQENYMK